MKRGFLIAHMIREGCFLHREGAKHSVFFNPENGHLAAVPRHREIQIVLAKKICHQLDISIPREKS